MKSIAVVCVLSLGVVAGCSSTRANPKSEQPPNQNAERAARATVLVSSEGYEPSAIDADADKPITLVFKRTSEEGCGDEIVFPAQDIRKPLPLNKEVEIKLTPKANERIAFTCGMGMYRGAVVAIR